MTFAWPWVLLGLLLVPALVLAERRLRARRALRRRALGELGLGSSAVPSRRLTGGLLLGALALLVVAAARPQATVGDLHREGTVILAIDSSTSMRATDLAPSRLEAARAAAGSFVQAQPPTIRVGVVSFADSGVVLQAPTTTQADVLAALGRLKAQGGTSLGQGIYASLQAISGGKVKITDEQLRSGVDDLDIGHFGSARIVLVSDGEDTSRIDPLALARLAGTAGVRIDTVGLGSPDGTTVQVDGFTTSTTLDETVLREVAETTGGHYLGAPDAATLADVYGQVDLELTTTQVRTDVGALVAAAALLLLVAGAGISVARTGRVV